MENIYIPGYGTFTSIFDVSELIYDYQGEPWEYDHEEFLRENPCGKIPSPMKGRKHSKKTKKSMSESKKGKKRNPFTEDHKRKLSEATTKVRKGTNTSEETKQKISETLMGRVFTEETKKRMSESRKGNPMPRYKCPHCNKVGGGGAMKQWHFDKCMKRQK